MTTNGVPGFSEGYRLGQAFADMMFSNRGMVIAHRIPGRRRYSCEAIKGRPEICSRIEDLLLGLDGFDSVLLHPYKLIPPAFLMILLMIGCHMVAEGLKESTG